MTEIEHPPWCSYVQQTSPNARAQQPCVCGVYAVNAEVASLLARVVAAETQVAQLRDGLVNIINNLTARLNGGADRTAALDALREARTLAVASGVAPDKPAPTCEHGETRPHDTFTVHMWPPPVRPVTCPGPDDAPDHDHRKAWDAHVTASRQAGLCEYSGMTVQRCKDIDLCDCFDQPNGDKR